MKNEITKIELVTDKGTFTFANHANAPETDLYGALCLFEANNWEIWGESYYVLTRTWEDETTTTETYNGMNSTADLACNFDEELAEEYNSFMQSQY